MEPLEFLGGKYQQPEQIVPGDVQTFRAHETATGRMVFIHRVSTLGSDPEQAALLRLVLLSLFRSSSAKRQILDFSDEPGFCYVVTESSPQCLLLKEWLQFEIDQPGAPVRAAKSEEASEVPPAMLPRPASPASLSMPQSKEPASSNAGEFTRMFTADTPIAAPPSPARPSSPAASAAPSTPEPPPATTPARDGGEFTRMFMAGTPPPSSPAPAAPEPPRYVPEPPHAPPAPAKSDNGEFTRFFSGGLPPAAPVSSGSSQRPAPPPANAPASAPPQRSADRPSNPGGLVQRPNTPPPPQLQGTETGEFTKMFSRNAVSGAPPDAPRAYAPPPRSGSLSPSDRQGFNFDNPRGANLPDLSNKRGDMGSMFDSAPEVPTPMPSASQTPGEYTRMFGPGAAAPGIQSPSPVADRPMVRLNDPFPEPAPPSAPAAPPGPGEFTRVIQGNRPGQNPQGGAADQHGQTAGGAAGSAAPSGGMPAMAMPAAPAASPSGGGGAGGSPVNLNITPINPMMAMGSAMHVPGMGGNLGGGMGSASAGMGNPLAGGNVGHASVMSPVGSAYMSGPNMQNAMHGSSNASHNPHAPEHAAGGGHGGGMKMPKMPGQLPKAPNVGMADRTKLLILFGVLALLVIVMILFVIFSAHK